MVRQLNLAEQIPAITRPIRTTIDIPIKNIRSRHIPQLQIRLMLITRHQSMTAAAIAAIPTQALRATRAALDHNTVLTTAPDRLLPVPVADPDHLRIPAPRPDPVRLLDQVRLALPRLPIPPLRVRTLRRTQATTHRPDQATVRRLHLRPRHLPRRRIQVAVVRHNR
jgi:hypothetical protein